MPGENLVVILQIHPKIQLAVLTVQWYCPDLLHWRVSSLRRPGRNIWPTWAQNKLRLSIAVTMGVSSFSFSWRFWWGFCVCTKLFIHIALLLCPQVHCLLPLAWDSFFLCLRGWHLWNKCFWLVSASGKALAGDLSRRKENSWYYGLNVYIFLKCICWNLNPREVG